MKHNKTPSNKVIRRQEKIKNVALELFLTKGYQETNLSDIIKLSGGSYSSIYENFKSKEGLFFEILDDVCKKHFALLSSKIQQIHNGSLEEILYSFGITYMEIFNELQVVLFRKIIYSQVYNKEKYLRKWMENNQENFAYDILIEYFNRQNNASIIANSNKLAKLFCAMLTEPYHTLNVLADTPLMDKNEQKAHVDFVDFIVSIFINGIPKG
ncbi:TetR/AcrR family transcriptional regulator [Campylobacter sp. MIT 21-1685]|uniref:TetR/AcrR family transcriptional regulator n=1 Tax=unclassified Campylobacter TaxID=2593542 RepID=UPI00224A95B0|nr:MULTISPECIES: TetR/AcrR family transcriptional regulator [unclassified Campylobacter]MCX2683495.1 TetR/AcrR family transcriptional regulator [Campylobacter sp. MIT 21-1684]MCX2751776.1 TetR/AcrR family transcriptional regulator [Campylobacter sp. MIT 21-1682]MCX2807977.1 TetR/AcrR family transcriptional regulator [Campylobacter sp. MIT 21-1685]